MMNSHRYIQDTMAMVVSSRRGSNFLLHNLEENDVVFGTKGNGRNEVFLKVLENHSEQYMQLSKFQKMGLIQQIIRDWKGNFYILNSKTNDLHLAKKKDHDLSTTDPSSRKLYTSVRRMMNYVNSKIQRKPQYPQKAATSADGTSILSETTAMTPVIPAIPAIPVRTLAPQAKKKHERKATKKSSTLLTNSGMAVISDNPPLSMTSMDYIRHEHVTLTLANRTLSSSPFTLENMIIPIPTRSTILVTPEPSPRSAYIQPPPISPLPLSKPELSLTSTIYTVPPLPPGTTALHTSDGSVAFSNQQITSTVPLSARFNETKEDIPSAINGAPGNLEESAILALISLGSSSIRTNS